MPWPTYQFDGYTLRPADATDLKLAAKWNDADPYHRHTTSPAYWIEQSPKVNSYVLEDEAGVVFFFRLDRLPNPETLWLNIQFAPEQKRRTVRGLVQGFRWLRKILPLNGVTAVYFTSRSETLLRFTDRRLGFRRDGNRMVAAFQG